MALTAKQEAFARAVASGLTHSDAYRQAYNATRMGAKGINESASRLAHTASVAARITALKAPTLDNIAKTMNVDLQACIFENARIGFSDVRRLFDETGALKPPSMWDDDTAAAVSSIKVRDLYGEGKDGKGIIGQVTEVKLWDKGAAQDRLMRHLGGYKKDNEQKDPLAAVGRDVLKLIEERLRGLSSAGPVVDRQPADGSPSQPAIAG